MNTKLKDPSLPETIGDLETLEELLSRPSDALIEDMASLDGDIIILGAGGKIGPSMARMARRAAPDKKVIAVARFSDAGLASALEADGIEIIRADLTDRYAVEALPEIANVMFLAGHKFGASGAPSLTWAMNSYMPGIVAERYRNSRIVAFSTGCVYPFVPVYSGGANEDLPLDPPGEYAMSCVGRERIFEYFSQKHQTAGILLRLNYAVEMRYGVLVDVAQKVLAGEPVDITMGVANVIWQGDVNDIALRALAQATVPTSPLNVSGPETVSIQWLAECFANRFKTEAKMTGTPADNAWLSNTAKANQLFGYPRVPLQQVVDWVADWVQSGKELHGKPTKFEVRDGQY